MSTGTWRYPRHVKAGRPRLTDPELRDWVENLAPTNEQRKAVVKELLYHANRDNMSVEDRQDCVKAQGWIDANILAERPVAIHRALTLDELEDIH